MAERIVINGRFLCRPMTGVDRYAIEVTKAIDLLLAEGHPAAANFQWEIVTPSASDQVHLKHIQTKVVKASNGLLWEQIALPLYSSGKLLLSLCNSAPLFKRKQFVVVHDAATVTVPQSYSTGFRRWYQLMIPSILRMSQKIGTVSKFSKQELLNIYRIPRHIFVLPEGAEHLLRSPADTSLLTKYQLQSRPFVLAVGSMAPHKNFKVLIDAVSLLKNPPFDLVIAGGTNPKVFSSNQHPLPEWVKHVGYVSDEQLRGLYEQAGCFVFPSKYEGYGLPPTEAMALGCPVICARSASLPEVCGDAAEYFDCNSPDELASLLLRFFETADMGARLQRLGLDNVKERTWRNAALAVIDCLQKDQA